MNRIRLDLKKAWIFKPWGRSCFFGEPDLLKVYLDNVRDDELFLAQINLEEYKKYNNTPLLPKEGILSFFIRLDDMTGVVRYNPTSKFDNKTMLRMDFNSSINDQYDVKTEYRINFIKHDKTNFKSGFFISSNRHELLDEDDIILLEYYSNDLNFMKDQNVFICFVIKKDELLNKQYDKTRLLLIRDRR